MPSPQVEWRTCQHLKVEVRTSTATTGVSDCPNCLTRQYVIPYA